MTSPSEPGKFPHVQWSFRRNEYDLLQEGLDWARKRKGTPFLQLKQEQAAMDFLMDGQILDDAACSCGEEHPDSLEVDEWDVPFAEQLRSGIEQEPLYVRVSAWARALGAWAQAAYLATGDPEAFRVSYFSYLIPMRLGLSLSDAKIGEPETLMFAAKEAETVAYFLREVRQSLARLEDTHGQDRLFKEAISQSRAVAKDVADYVLVLAKLDNDHPL